MGEFYGAHEQHLKKFTYLYIKYICKEKGDIYDIYNICVIY